MRIAEYVHPLFLCLIQLFQVLFLSRLPRLIVHGLECCHFHLSTTFSQPCFSQTSIRPLLFFLLLLRFSNLNIFNLANDGHRPTSLVVDGLCDLNDQNNHQVPVSQSTILAINDCTNFIRVVYSFASFSSIELFCLISIIFYVIV